MNSDRFFKTVFGKKPALLNDDWIRLSLDEPTLLQAIRKSFTQKSIPDVYSPVRTAYVGTTVLQGGYDPFFPPKSIFSTEQYLECLQREFQGSRFAFILAHFHEFLPDPAYRRVKSLATKIGRLANLKGAHVDFFHFLGDYEKTPYGVHQDGAHTFCYVYRGQKTFRFWKENELSHSLLGADPLNYHRLKRKSFTITAAPGEVIYWPPTYWHVGESSHGINQSCSLFFNVEFMNRSILKNYVQITKLVMKNLPEISALDGLTEFQEYLDQLELGILRTSRSASLSQRLTSEYLALNRNFGLDRQTRRK